MSIAAAEKTSVMPVLPINCAVLVMVHPSAGNGSMVTASISLLVIRTQAFGLLALNFVPTELPAGMRETGTLASGRSGRAEST
jgi:hypothetical protein